MRSEEKKTKNDDSCQRKMWSRNPTQLFVVSRPISYSVLQDVNVMVCPDLLKMCFLYFWGGVKRKKKPSLASFQVISPPHPHHLQSHSVWDMVEGALVLRLSSSLHYLLVSVTSCWSVIKHFQRRVSVWLCLCVRVTVWHRRVDVGWLHHSVRCARACYTWAGSEKNNMFVRVCVKTCCHKMEAVSLCLSPRLSRYLSAYVCVCGSP